MLYIVVFILIFGTSLFLVFLRLKKEYLSKTPSSRSDFEVLEVVLNKSEEAPREIQLSATLAENMFSALHGLLREDASLQEQVSFEIVSSSDRGIRFYVVAPSGILKFVESQLYAQYPTAQIRVVEDYTQVLKNRDENQKVEVASVGFSKPIYFPIKGFREFEVDPLSSITSALASVQPGEEIWMQFLVKPIADGWQEEGFKYVSSVRTGDSMGGNSVFSDFLNILKKEGVDIFSRILTGLFTYKDTSNDRPKPKTSEAPKLTYAEEMELRLIETKLSRMGFKVNINILTAANSPERLDSNLRSTFASMKQFSTNLNGFTYEIDKNFGNPIENYTLRNFNEDRSIILNTEEIATVFHFPLANIDTPTISWAYSKKSEPPSNLPTTDCCYIGETMFRNKKLKFGLKNDDDRLRHLYVIGKSGTGKSTLLESMISQDIANGAGVGVLDPHGETIERVLERIPDNRVEDVVYFDPSDTEMPIGLNLLEIDDPSQKNLMASGLVSAIKQHFDFSWGPRLEYLLNYAILTLLDVPGTTLLGITRLLEDQNYQRFILHQVKDPVVQRFWEEEYKQMKGNQKLVTEAISPIQNKVNRFLASTTIRNILGHQKSTLDIWDAMNSGKIILMNLSKGKIGSDNANLLGALLVSRIQFYALQRVKIPYEQRRPFYLYVDEFQNFATGSFEEILSESRKYKLGLYLTHQFTAQLPENLLKAVYGNVGTIMAFALGAPDAREFANEFAPYFSEEDLISLERFQVYIKLMVDGMSSHPFSARILVPWEEGGAVVPKSGNKENVIKYSREKYGVPRSYVEDKIYKWVNTKFDKGMAISQEYKKSFSNLTENDINSKEKL